MKRMVAVMLLLMLPVLAAAEPVRERHRNEQYRFSIEIPDSWRVITDYNQMVPVAFVSPSDGPGDRFAENINVVVEPFPTGGVDDYFTANIESMRGMMNGFTLIEDGACTAGDLPCHRAVYTHSYSQRTLKVLVFFYVFHGRGYVVTCTALPENFDRYRTIFETIAASLKKE